MTLVASENRIVVFDDEGTFAHAIQMGCINQRLYQIKQHIKHDTLVQLTYDSVPGGPNHLFQFQIYSVLT